MAQDFDIAIVGGGPAGAVFAWLAARDGRRVALIDPGRSAPRIEGLSPRLQGWLGHMGLWDAAALQAAPVPRISLWDGRPVQANHETIIERAALDRHLRDAAQHAGAVLIPTSARPAPGRAELPGGQMIAAPLVVDARGRRAYRGCEGIRRGPTTLAIGARLRMAQQVAGTWVLPLDQGWLWLACPGDGRGWLQLVLDAAGDDDPPAERLAQALQTAAPHLPPIAAVLPDLLIRDATPVLAPPPADLSVIPVGDAASAMDPLSGHGLFWAISSALAATAVRRTLEARDDPATRDLSLRFLRQRYHDTYPRQARLGRDFIRSQTPRAEHAFWSRRAAFPDDLPLNANDHAPRIETRIVVEHGLLTEAPVVLTPHAPAGIAWIGGRRAPDLLADR